MTLPDSPAITQFVGRLKAQKPATQANPHQSKVAGNLTYEFGVVTAVNNTAATAGPLLPFTCSVTIKGVTQVGIAWVGSVPVVGYQHLVAVQPPLTYVIGLSSASSLGSGPVVPWARAWATGTSAVGSGSGVQINLAGFDLHNGFTHGTNSLIIPVAGTYQAEGAINGGTTSNGLQAQILQQGTQMTGNGVYSQSTSCLLVCNAGDVITLTAFNNTGTSVTFGTGSNGSLLHVYLVSRA